MSMPSSYRLAIALPTLLCVGAIAAGDPPVTAADEDLIKLLDRQPAVANNFDPGDGNGDERAFDSQNMTLLSWLSVADFPGGSTGGNDCWGYVSPSDREYAIMGLQKGFGFVEVTDPSNPVIIGYVAGPSSSWHDIKVIGEYAYGVSEGGSGIQVVDLSDIDNGNVRHVGNVTQQGHTSTHNIVANTDSGYLYLVGGNIQNGGLVALSTADPENPTIAGAWGVMYVHDAQVITYESGPYAGREIAYCLSGFSGGSSQTGLRIVDVTDKNNMFTISTVSWEGARYSHQGWLSEDRQLLYINDELDEGNTVSVTTTRVFDVSDITDPTFQGIFTTGLPAIDHNLYTHNGMIFQSNYRSGLRVFETSDPVNPTEIAYFDTYPSDNNNGFNGTWSNYPFLPSGTILISDIERGLFMVRIDGVSLDLIDAPVEIQPNTPTPITIQVTETSDTYDHNSVKLNYSLTGGALVSISMSDLGDDIFTATLPGADCFDTFDYYASAITDSGTEVVTESVHALVAGDKVTAIEYDGESDGSWTAGDAGDNATTGIWNRMNPEATDAQPEDDVTAGGTDCWVTDGRAGDGLGTYDVDGGKTTLKSPVYDLTALNDPFLGVWVWYSNNTGADPNNDIFRIDFSSDSGSTWTNAKTLGPADEFSSGGWYYHEFRAADTVTPNAEDAHDGSIIEAAVDELIVFDYDCNDCAADFNGDGDVNTQDVLSFLNAWNAGDDSADINGDGTVNTRDVIAFLNLWAAGC
jgi:choice-of-anchor B domain-containing protein